MTIVFTAATPYIICMTADSAVTLEFDDYREYDVGRKSYFYPGVGCVMTWGARDQNRIGEYLEGQDISAETHEVGMLADLVETYLSTEFLPHKLGLDDVGYHVAGFDKDRRPRLWHIFYGFDRPQPAIQVERAYKRYDHTPRDGVYFLYNGRNDLAHVLIQTILQQIQGSRDTNFDLGSPVDLARFSDFIARFAAEITPEVGPPFITYVISNNNQGLTIRNLKLAPPDRNVILEALSGIGYDGD